MVDTKFTTAAQKEDKKKRKDKEIEKEKKEKKNKKTKSSETLEDGSVAPETLTLDWENGKVLPKKGKGWEILLTSIAVFLESNGFTKTHSVFRSEAHLEKDGLVASFINLEDLFCKYLESSKGHADATIDWPEEKDIENSGIPRKDEGENIHDASEHIHKKKRKHKYETDDGTKAEINEHGLENGSIKCLKVKSKEKEMNRSAPAGCSAENTGVFGDKNMNELNSLGNIKDLKMLKSAEDSHVETKDKKKKNKYVSDSLEENGRKSHLEDSCRTAENTIAHHDNLLPKTDVNDKAKRKKKNKMSSDACDENTESGDHRKFQEIVEEKIEELKSLTNNSSVLLLESNAKHKREKKKKTKAASDALAWTGREEYAKEDLRKSDSGKENVTVSEENVDNIGKKAHKKRKRSASEERASQAENEMIAKESIHVNLNGAENNKETGALQKPDKSLPDSEYTTIGKTRKTEKSSENPNQTFETSLSQQNPSAQDIQKELGGHQMANGNPEKNEKEGGASSKSMKKEKHSAEAKTVNAFQRVKIDVVKFADERLQDNSYWALDGTGSGYGAKAQEVLGQVRGRDFRHEKTKKKRGTYRGGQIDLQSHSIKFNYSDEE